MKAAEDVLSPCSYCLSSIDKKLRFRDTETVKKRAAVFYRQ